MASSPPPSLQTYEDILNALNRDVARARPDDPLQFCASWFNDKLAEQRAASRNAITREASPAAMMDITPAVRRDSSPRAFSPPPKSALKKKASGSQLANSGYTFGSSSTSASGGPTHASHLGSMEPMPSPFSEGPPPGPFGLSGVSPHGMSRASVAAAASAAAHTSSPSWSSSSRQQPLPHSSLSASTRSRPVSDDEEDAGHRTPSSSSVAQMPSTSSGGIPLAYNLGRRTSVSAESLDPDAMTGPKRVITKSSSQRKRIEAVMSQNLLFRNLDEDQHNDVINAMEETTVGQGTVIINQGDVGEIFYIVEHGSFDVYKRPDQIYAYDDPSAPPRITSPPPSASGSAPLAKFGKLVGKVEAGGHFGELALMYNAPRAASVICTSPVSVLWSVDRVTFRSILMEHTSKKRRMYERFLGEVPILATLEPHERAKIADSLEERVYEEGEAVVIEGEVGKNFYLIQSGRAEVTKRRGGTGQEEAVSALKEGDYFGELALINSAPRAATVRALSGHGRLRVVTLGEKAFTRLLGPAVELLQRRAQTAYQSGSAQSSYHARQGSQAGLEHLRSSRGASGPPPDRYGGGYGQQQSISVGE